MKAYIKVFLPFLIVFIFSGCLANELNTSNAVNNQTSSKSEENFKVPLLNEEGDLRENKEYSESDFRAYSIFDRKYNPKVKEKIGDKQASKAPQHVWVYTKEFAERFGMPKRWIAGDDFKGALAIAYRVEITNDISCGYFGKSDNCRKIYSSEILDIYLPNNSKTVPWNTTEQIGLDWPNNNSMTFLNLIENTENEKNKYIERNGSLPKEYGINDYYKTFKIKIGIDSVSKTHSFKKDGFASYASMAGGGDVLYFHRNIFEGIDLIRLSVVNFANSNNGKNTDMQIWFHRGNPVDLTDKNSDDFRLKNIKYARSIDSTGKPSSIKPHKDVMPEHKIIPSEAFMKRVNEYEKEYEKYDFFEYFKENVNK